MLDCELSFKDNLKSIVCYVEKKRKYSKHTKWIELMFQVVDSVAAQTAR